MWIMKIYFGDLDIECRKHDCPISNTCETGKIIEKVIPAIIDSGYVSCSYSGLIDHDLWREVVGIGKLNLIYINSAYTSGCSIHKLRDQVVMIEQYDIYNSNKTIAVGIFNNT